MVPDMSSPPATEDALALPGGCTVELDATFPIAAVMQVPPGPSPGVRMRSEVWDTAYDHHSYVDLYGNRCERLEIAAGSSRITYEAQLLLSNPADVIDLDAREIPVAELPHE